MTAEDIEKEIATMRSVIDRTIDRVAALEVSLAKPSLDLWPLIQPWLVSKTSVGIVTFIGTLLAAYFGLPLVQPTKVADVPAKTQPLKMEETK